MLGCYLETKRERKRGARPNAPPFHCQRGGSRGFEIFGPNSRNPFICILFEFPACMISPFTCAVLCALEEEEGCCARVPFFKLPKCASHVAQIQTMCFPQSHRMGMYCIAHITRALHHHPLSSPRLARQQAQAKLFGSPPPPTLMPHHSYPNYK